MPNERCPLCLVAYPEDELTELPSGFKLCTICQLRDKIPLREGLWLKDVRYGFIEVLAVTEKKVWYQRTGPHHQEKPGSGIHHTSKQRATEFLLYGPDWAEVPRWKVPEHTLVAQGHA